jgi:SAM-dependent methyltransferase
LAEQTWRPHLYTRNAGFVAEFGADLIEMLAPRRGEWILDLGCGDGALTVLLAQTGAQVVGVDACEAMVEAARRRGVDARVADGRRLPFDSEFDAVFSNAALHWMGDLGSVLAGVGRSLKAGGRFVGELGGEGNVAAERHALYRALRRRGIDPVPLDPWTFVGAKAFGALLSDAGFEAISVADFRRPTPLPGDLADWLATFAGSFLAPLGENDRRSVVAEVCDELAPVLRGSDGVWQLDYVRLRFSAFRRPAAS